MADVEPVSRGFGYARFLAVEDHVLRHRRFDGAMSAPLVRAVLASGDAATVLPFDPARGRVLLVEQVRAGPFARRDPHPWTLEAVAGRCDGMEPPEETARREAREEAGVELGRLERIAGFYPTPGIAAEFITAFIGEADLGADGGVHGLAAEDEDIRTIVVPLARAFAALASGEVSNAPLLVSLLWLQRHHRKLAAGWGRAGG
jgi:nudix-type nucleoside diphosphatase (YffH/AdpP family)